MTPQSGTGSGSLTVSVQPAGLPAGSYRNRINISLGRFGTTVSVDVVLNVAVPQSRVQEFPILTGATLSFLGLGPQPPTPEWGAMIAEGRQYLLLAWWMTTLPGLALLVVGVGLSLIGDGLAENRGG